MTPFLAGYADTNRIRTTTCPRAATNVSPAKKRGSDQLDLKQGVMPLLHPLIAGVWMRPDRYRRCPNRAATINHRHELEPLLLRVLPCRHTHSSPRMLRQWLGLKRGKVSSTWPPSSTATPRKSSAGPLPITCEPNSSPMHSRMRRQRP